MTTGLVGKNFYVTGLSWTACYLLDGGSPVLFEAGHTCAGRLYEEDIREILQGREPEILFLTHVHYDHCGAAAYLKRVFPSLRIAASEKAARIIERPNAQKLMTELSSELLSFYLSDALKIDKSKVLDEPFQPFKVDIIIGEGRTIDLGDTTLQVMATPGHTGDMLSYYIPEKKILIATESAGCQDKMGHIVISPLVDYDIFFSSLKRLAALPVEIFCQGHHIVWVGSEEVQDYFARAIAETEQFREHVEHLLCEEQGSVERVVARIKAEEYDTNTEVKQPEAAYLINLHRKVSNLRKKLRDISKVPL